MKTDYYTKFRFILFFFAGTVVSVPLMSGTAEAIPPPELVRMGSVLVQVLGVLVVFFSTTFFIIRDRIRALFASIHGKWIKVMLLSLPVVVIALVLYGVAHHIHRKNKEILADAAAVKETATLAEGVLTVAGLQLDIADPSFKIEPKEAAKHLGAPDYVFIDIREPVEFSVRRIPGFVNIRLGDLLAGGEYQKIDKKKKIVLLCEIGERGSNITVILRVRGYEAFYIEKGIRGWLEQGQKFIGNKKMFLPDFNNKYKDLTRDETKKLVAAGTAVLVDLRSPTEFGKGHIEGSVNLPLVNLPTPQLEDALNQLPKDKIVIGIAYERFGAYYCKILGYHVEQRKGRFGGTLKIKQQNQAL